MDAASTQQQARATWITPYAFEPSNGGLGINMDATSASGSSSRKALVGSGFIICVSNEGEVGAFLALGDSSVTATTNHLYLQPGNTQVFALSESTGATHAAVITRSGATNIQITRGFGV